MVKCGHPGLFNGCGASGQCQTKHQEFQADEQVVIAHEISHPAAVGRRIMPYSRNLAAIKSTAARAGFERLLAARTKEVQADVFAGEFLCPADWLRDEYIDRDPPPARIAEGAWCCTASGHEPDNPCLAVAADRPPAHPPSLLLINADQEAAATSRGEPFAFDWRCRPRHGQDPHARPLRSNIC